MSMTWKGLDAYVFPPWAMIAEVLNKLQQEVCILTLIVPRWPNRHWFPDLLSLLVDKPVRLPLREDLISMPLNKRLYHDIKSLDLHACRVSSDPRLRRDFLNGYPSELCQDSGGIRQQTYMIQGGGFLIFGVVNGALILSQPL